MPHHVVIGVLRAMHFCCNASAKEWAEEQEWLWENRTHSYASSASASIITTKEEFKEAQRN